MIQNGINMFLIMSIFWASWFLIIYTYVIFPIILSVLSFYLKKDNYSAPLATSDRPEFLPKVAMVVAAYNEEKVISEKLNNSWAIDYPHDRFILVVGSDGSDDKTNNILSTCEDKRLFFYNFNQRRGKISIINDIMSDLNRNSDVEIIVMSDANTIFDKNSIRNLVRHFENPKIGCVSGELILSQDGGVSGEGLYWKYECWIKNNESKLGFLIGCNGGIFAIRKEVYEPLPSSVIVEDFVMTMRLLEKGWQVKFDPEARGSEPPCPTSKAEMI
jgi:cellulose synthase/poly-beta-1,6-N-acetylglucosamine synthase-like glycosyltransferase